jgi:3-ketoacyl-CoA synthase
MMKFAMVCAEAKRAKYAMKHLVRVHMGADEAAYRCVYQKPDDEGEFSNAICN